MDVIRIALALLLAGIVALAALCVYGLGLWLL